MSDQPSTVSAPIPEGSRGFYEPTKLRQWVIDAAKNSFEKKLNTVESKNFKLRVKDLTCDVPHFTLEEQHHAILHQEDLTVPLKGIVELVDKNTGEVKDTKHTTIARVPWITPLNTAIISGNSYAVINQQRLLPGVYTRIKRTGEPEAHINVQSGTGLGGAVTFDPESAIFSLKSGSTHTKLYGLLHDMGVSDSDMQKAWGHEVWLKNKAAYKGNELDKFHDKLLNVKSTFNKLMGTNNDQEKNKLISDLLLSKFEGIESAVNSLRSDQTRMFEDLKARHEALQHKDVDLERSLAEIAKCNQRHEHALFGVNGDNGLNSEVKNMKEDVKVLDRWKLKVAGMALGAGLAAGIVKDLLIAGWTVKKD